jgi:probable HAF family extracellular repeat protein
VLIPALEERKKAAMCSRSVTKLGSFIALVSAAATAGCGVGDAVPVGSVRATLKAAARHDVAKVRYVVVSAGESCAGRPVAQADVPLQEETLPATAEPDGGTRGTSHAFADAFFTLAPGDYDVCVQPSTASGAASRDCAAAHARASVTPGQTTEIVIASQCRGDANGGLDAIIVLNDPPRIDRVDVAPNKFIEVCTAATVSATSSDPNGDAVVYAWQVVSAPPEAMVTLTASGAAATFSANVAATYEVKVTVTDAHGASTSLTFPIHVTGERPSRYQVVEVGLLGGTYVSEAFDLNGRGDVVGVSENTVDSLQSRAFLWSAGALTNLGNLGFGLSVATGINDGGRVVGYSMYRTDAGNFHAFEWQGGVLTDINPSGSSCDTSAAGVNNRGDVVGTEQCLSDVHVVVWKDGVMTALPGPAGGSRADAAGINDAGQIVGTVVFVSGGYRVRPYLWADGVATDLGTLPGTANAFPSRINPSGDIVGHSSNNVFPFTSRATLWHGGQIVELGALPGHVGGQAVDINSGGVAVGISRAEDGSQAAVVWEHGRVANLNDRLDPASAGWQLDQAKGINDSGEIAGTGRNLRGITVAFLLRPSGALACGR